MSAITIRNLPPKLAKAIREKARKERLSMNKAVIKLLEQATGATQELRKVVHHDLDRFFGTWTREEADAFDQALREQRQIDPSSSASCFSGSWAEASSRGTGVLLRVFVESPRVAVLALDEETAERYAAIRDYLRRQGIPLPVNDLWIAASAAQHGLRLLTLDDHFKRVPQVLVEYFQTRS